ncbi:MAG: hypothetical protein ACKOVA_17950, partial [Novosphingobium sp.]
IGRGEFTCADPKMASRTVASGIIFAALWRGVSEPVGAEPIDVDWMAECHAEVILAGLKRV